MKLTHLANQRVVISRLQAVTGTSDRLTYSTVTAALGALQAVTGHKLQSVQGVPGKTYRVFLDGDIDIQEADQLKDEDGNIYTVKKGGSTRWQHGAMDYKEVLLEQS